MARAKPKLTWQVDPKRKAGGRWTRVYNGKRFTYGDVENKSDRLGYQRAIEAFDAFKAKAEPDTAANKPHKAEYEQAIRLRLEMLEWMRLDMAATPQADLPDDGHVPGVTPFPETERADADEALFDRLNKEVAQLQSDMRKVHPPPLNDLAVGDIDPNALWVFPLVGMWASEAETWVSRLQSLREHRRWTQAPSHAATVEAHAKEYLIHQRSRAESNQIKATTYKAIYERLAHFVAYAGQSDATTLDGKTLSSFQAHLLRRVASGEFKDQYAKHLLSEAKSFVRWLWQNETLEKLPRNLDTLTITVEQADFETFPVAELKTLLDAASERTRLFLLLQLNCGYYPSDLARLKRSEVDWTQGRIIRKRTKSERHKAVPKVCYRLWDETFDLLKRHRSDHETLALTNENGEPLLRRNLQADDTVGHTHNIGKAYERLTAKLKRQGIMEKAKPMMLLRKTAASKLEEHESYGRFAQYFLGQAPQSLAERRYAKPSPERFDDALKWLGEQFGFPTNRPDQAAAS